MDDTATKLACILADLGDNAIAINDLLGEVSMRLSYLILGSIILCVLYIRERRRTASLTQTERDDESQYAKDENCI